ncbi:hypothetical protein TSUD_130570, partial [Trifolium subterraneum]
ILSDCIPIKGSKRISYLVIATVLSLVPWIILGLSSSLRNSTWHLMVFLTVQNLGSAMADVVVDAMIAEAVRYDNFVNENSVNSEALVEDSIENDSLTNGSTLDEASSSTRKSHSSTRKRKKGKKNSKNRAANTSKSKILEKGDSLATKWSHSLQKAIYDLCHAFRQPMILRPMSWFFLAHITVPNLSTVLFYYETEVLKLEASFLGTVRVVGWLGLMFGTFIYNRHLKHMTLRRILMWAHLGLAFLNILQIAVVSRKNIDFGIPDWVMVLFGSALVDGINQFKFMPFLILSGQLCPPGIEGTLFALFMSINNFGTTIGSFVGAGLASILNIHSGSFDNLLLGIVIHALCNFIPIAFLFLIPQEATGSSSS